LNEGQLEVEDLPGAWNEKMQQYLKLDTRDDYENGCLQDVHWSAGLFGYFPTYTLGAMMAAQLFAAARQDLPDLAGNLSGGEFAPLLNWLRSNIHSRGKFLSSRELLVAATGQPLQVAPFREHLEARYLA
jgi:carboxypeptidase Taq